MGIVVALIVGGVAGWLASLVMSRDASMGIVANILVGIVGGVLGNLAGNALLGMGDSITEFSFGNLMTAFVGAIVLLGVLNLVQRGRVR